MGKHSEGTPGSRTVPYNQPIKFFGEPVLIKKQGPERKTPRRRRSRPGGLRAELIALARQLKKVQAAARTLGLFAEDRELLTCPRCGLQEDVAIDGRLIVTVQGDRHCDTGLRFSPVSRRGDWWCCPNCKAVLKEPATDFRADAEMKASRRLAALGGTQPKMKAPRRRRLK